MADSRIALISSSLVAGDTQSALNRANDALADGALPMADRVAALVLRARIHEAAGDLDRSILDLEGALALDLAQARIWNELGLVCADAGRAERSLAAFERAVHIDAGYARGWNNLGNALRGVGRIADAVRAFERATAADPAYVLAWSNLGGMRREAGDDAGAESALRRALALAPDHPGALTTLAGLLRQHGDLDQAAPMFRRAAALDPRDANVMYQLGGTLAESDDLDAAHAAFAEARRRDPRHLRAAMAECLTLPMVPAGVGAIAAARSAYDRGLHQLEKSLPAAARGLPPERLLDELRWSNFLLAYQGGDDRDLQRRYADLAGKLVAAVCPEWRNPLACRTRGVSRVRVGFVSASFRDRTAGRYFERWVTDLPREHFEVWVYHLAPQRDALTERIAARADHFRSCPLWRPSQIAPRVRADHLDVLVYPELGMAAATFALAALRLAPLQCAGWGHPVTTGHSTIDVYLSCEAMEPPGAASHYTEKLVTLPGIGTRYPRPWLPAPATREQFGLPEGVPLLLCPQSLFKIHPDNDRLFARVLGELPSARLVYFAGRHPRLTAALRARLAAAGIAAERTVVLPQCSHDDYLRVNTLCDLMLDTVHWSGGNTSLDALAAGLPIVTLPGAFMRSRQSAGMLSLMGMNELVAADPDDYVAIATRLGSDRDWRHGLVERIIAAQSLVFDDPAPMAALAAFLRE